MFFKILFFNELSLSDTQVVKSIPTEAQVRIIIRDSDGS